MKRILFFAIICIHGLLLKAQPSTLSIDQCYELARKNYPAVKQFELIVKSKEYSLENISKGYMPQVTIFGQATLQSDVTQINIKLPNVSFPEISKDQYRIYIDVNQPIYEGGVIKEQKAIQAANAAVEQEKLEVELYKLKERVNQLFFGILLLEEQLKQNELLRKDIQLGMNKVQAGIDNGTALKSSLTALKAEYLKTEQRNVELKYARKAYADMLSLFTKTTIDERVLLLKPKKIIPSEGIKRPEIQWFNSQNNAVEAQFGLLNAKNRPKLNFFVQGGFGRPAFNILSNSFDPYYIGGVRLNFPLGGFYTLKNEKQLLDLNKQNIELQKETFLFNTGFAMKQQNAEIDKMQEILKTDDEIVTLRNQIKNTAFSQMDNGIINTNDYLKEVNAEDAARQTKILHEIQLLMAQYNLQTTSGN